MILASSGRGGGRFEVMGPAEYVAALRSLVAQLRNECAASGARRRRLAGSRPEIINEGETPDRNPASTPLGQHTAGCCLDQPRA